MSTMDPTVTDEVALETTVRGIENRRHGAASDAALLPPVLEVENLHVHFMMRGNRTTVVDGLSYKLSPGRTIAIIGESGSGKTVSSRAMMGLLPGYATATGSVKLGGVELLNLHERQLRKHLGPGLAMVFQDPSRSLNPTMKVGAQVTEAVHLHSDLHKDQARKRAVELLNLVRLPDPSEQYFQYPHQLSGGMRQRVVIAMALACKPKVLFADEATSSLDVTTQSRIMDLLTELQAELNMAIVLISHNLGLAAAYSDEVVVLYAGRVMEQAPTRELFARVKMPYTKLLLDAIPRMDQRGFAGATVPTERSAMEMGVSPASCPFVTRCPRAQERCLQEAPPLREDDHGHSFACWFPYEDGGTE